MAQSTQCYLPRFASAVDGPKRPISMKTRPTAAQNAQLSTAWDEGRLDSILRATWALVLHYYIRTEDISFGYQHLESDSCSQSVQRADGDISTFCISINDNDSLTAIVDKVRANDSMRPPALSETSEGHLPFNTILTLRTYDPSAATSTPIVTSALPEEVSEFGI